MTGRMRAFSVCLREKRDLVKRFALFGAGRFVRRITDGNNETDALVRWDIKIRLCFFLVKKTHNTCAKPQGGGGEANLRRHKPNVDLGEMLAVHGVRDAR